MTGPLSFEVEEVEGADLGQVAGRERACARCGGVSWTGEVCTACFHASIPWVSLPPFRFKPLPAEVMVERPEQRKPEWVREQPASCPQPVHLLERAAEVAGWRTRMVWSRGWEPKGSHVELISVRFSWPATGRAAFACYRALVRPEGQAMSWSWDSIYLWGPDLSPYGGCGLADLKYYLAHQAEWDGMELEAWVTGVREGRSDQAEVKKQRDADRAEVKRLHSVGGVSLTSLVLSAPAKRQGWTIEDVTKICTAVKRNRKSEDAS